MYRKVCALLNDEGLSKRIGNEAKRRAICYGAQNVKQELAEIYFLEK